MIRAWDISIIVDQSTITMSGKKTIVPYRSWNPHTLSVKDINVMGILSSIRVISCSIDRTVIMYDVHSGKQCFRFSLPHPLEAIVCNYTQDIAFVGSTNGEIYTIDLSIAAIGLSAAHTKIGFSSITNNNNSNIINNNNSLGSNNSSSSSSSKKNSTTPSKSNIGNTPTRSNELPNGTSVLTGHTRAVSTLSCSIDNNTLISSSQDGSLRVWDIDSRQCLREVKPLNKTSLSNSLVVLHSEHLLNSIHKPTLTPCEHLKKYSESSTSGSNTSSTPLSSPYLLSPRLMGSVTINNNHLNNFYKNPDSIISNGSIDLAHTAKIRQKAEQNEKKYNSEFITEEINDNNIDNNIEDNNNNINNSNKNKRKSVDLGDCDFIALPMDDDDNYMSFTNNAAPFKAKNRISGNSKSSKKNSKSNLSESETLKNRIKELENENMKLLNRIDGNCSSNDDDDESIDD
jgi:WD40 repeat protein